MNRIGLRDECKNMELIIEDLNTGKETCEIGDDKSIIVAVIPFIYYSYITFLAFKDNPERYTEQRQQKTMTTNNQDTLRL